MVSHEHHLVHLKKSAVIAIVIITLILGTIPIIVLEVGKIRADEAKAATLTIKPYPSLAWSDPKAANFEILLNEQTSDEKLVLTRGEQSLAISQTDIADQVASYYDKLLVGQGFKTIKTINSPSVNKYWVVGYQKDNNYFEVQYYPTPGEPSTFTTLVFFGTLQKNN